MFPNLNAEQARNGKSNADMANLLGISRVAYEDRKKKGRFSVSEANKICDYFHCEYSYIFAEVPLIPITWERFRVEHG